MAVAEYVTKLHAICLVCGGPANHSQRVVEMNSRVLLGAAEAYEPRCRHCFSPSEILNIAKVSGLSLAGTFRRLKAAGLDSMPGGGAEIFDEKVRDYICKGKVTSEQWFEIHRKWHERGKKSNVTMLFGHVESRANRIDHMMRIRSLQDITGGFNCFIPLVYQTENNYLNIKEPITANEILKTIAKDKTIQEKRDLIEALIRAYDPCLSCSTH